MPDTPEFTPGDPAAVQRLQHAAQRYRAAASELQTSAAIVLGAMQAGAVSPAQAEAIAHRIDRVVVPDLLLPSVKLFDTQTMQPIVRQAVMAHQRRQATA